MRLIATRTSYAQEANGVCENGVHCSAVAALMSVL